MSKIKPDFSKFKPKNPIPAIKDFFITKPHIWLSFAIPFGVLFASYMLFGVWPSQRGDPAKPWSVLSLDLNAQYVYYFQHMKDALFGSESLLYSWSRNLSGEFVGIIGYYVLSPFNLIVWVFPLSHITEGLMLMMLTKVGFIGVTMAIYLSYSRGFGKHTTVMFSIMYALLSYNIVQTMNPMWLDGVMALPLVVMGIESVLKHGKYKLLIFSLTYSFITCFYIGYMIAIFTTLYYIYYALTSRKFTRGNIIVVLKRTGLFAAAALISAAISAFILLPVYSALSMGKLEFSNPDYSLRANFNFLDITRKFFLNSYDTVRMPEGMPFLFSGTVTLLLFPIYFFCDKIRRARRLGGILLVFALITSMMIVPFDMFWHGMQNPNWLPYRYSFMLCFLFIAFGAEVFEHLKKIPHKSIGISAVVLAGLLIYWQAADTFESTLGDKGRDVFDWLSSVMPSMIAVIGFASILILAKNKLKKENVISFVLIALVVTELLFNTQNSIERQHTDIYYSNKESFQSMVFTRQVMDDIIAADDGFWRSEKRYIRSACDPMALRMKGVTHSSSMLNERAIVILKNMGYSSRSHASRYSGNTPLTDDLLGFKYILSAPTKDHSSVKSKSDITVYENPNVMPLLYLTNPQMKNFTFDGPDNPFLNQNKLLSQMLEQGVSRIRTADTEITNLEVLEGDYTVYSKNETVGNNSEVDYTDEIPENDAYIDYSFYAEQTGHYYLQISSDYKGNEYSVSVRTSDYSSESGEVTTEEYDAEEIGDENIHYLGYFNSGDSFRVILTLESERLFVRREIFMVSTAKMNDIIDDLLMEHDYEDLTQAIYQIQDDILTYILDDETVDEHFAIANYNSRTNEKVNQSGGSHTIYAKSGSGSASIKYEVYADVYGDVFAYFPGSVSGMFELSVNGTKIPETPESELTRCYYLGKYGDTYLEVVITPLGNEIFFGEGYFARVNEDILAFEGEAAERYYARMLTNLKRSDEDGGRYIEQVAAARQLNNVTADTRDDGNVNYSKSGGEATIEYSFTTSTQGDYYAYFPGGFQAAYRVLVNGELVESVFGEGENAQAARYLGSFERGENVKVTLSLTGDSVVFGEAVFARAKYSFEDERILRNQERAISILGEDATGINSYFKRIHYHDSLPAGIVQSTTTDNHTSYKRAEGATGNAHMEYFFTAEEAGDYYVYMPTSFERKSNLWVNDSFISVIFETDNYHIHHLGNFERGEDFKVTLSLLDKNEVFFKEQYFMRLDKDLLESDIARLHKTNENTVFEGLSNTHLRLTTNHPKEMMVFTSIPNEPGWKITVNGKTIKKEEIEEIAGGLIAISVPAGENVVEMKFFPNRMPSGILLTFAGIAGLIVLNMFMARLELREQMRVRLAAKSKKKLVRVVSDVRDVYDESDYDDDEDDDDEVQEKVKEVKEFKEVKEDKKSKKAQKDESESEGDEDAFDS
ncbi:MAG: YfhO family protein [Oscillospiraceae bacterium]|nr:YfhO family protein [Oscillospiraceae bacterium]